MTGCKDAFSDIGKYSQATVVYSGLKAGSLVLRTGEAIKDGAVHSANALVEAGEYSLATVQYAGLVSYSILKRSSQFTGACAKKAVEPVAKAVSPVAKAMAKPFALLADKTGKLFAREGKCEESVKSLEDRVLKLEERLSTLEKFGLRPKVAIAQQEKKLVSDDRRAFLRAVVEENKLLRAS